MTLARERVLATMLSLVDAEGLHALIRRRLGRELGHDAIVCIATGPDQAALLDGIVELVLSELVILEDGHDWQPAAPRCAQFPPAGAGPLTSAA